jgi:hypothetical protein
VLEQEKDGAVEVLLRGAEHERVGHQETPLLGLRQLVGPVRGLVGGRGSVGVGGGRGGGGGGAAAGAGLGRLDEPGAELAPVLRGRFLAIASDGMS